MADNRFDAIVAKYKALDSPSYVINPNHPNFIYQTGPAYMAKVKRRRELITMIRAVLREWNITYNWGAASDWWQVQPIETYNDINNWYSPAREALLRTELIEHHGFFRDFIDNFNSIISQFGGVLSLPLLAPFKRAMKKMLADNNKSTSGNLKEVSTRFFNEIVKKSSFEHIEDVNLNSQNPLGNGGTSDIAGESNAIPFGAIIQAIVNFFKLFIKNNAGTAKDLLIEKLLNEDSKKAATLITQERSIENNEDTGFDFKIVGILLLAAVGVYMIYRALSH